MTTLLQCEVRASRLLWRVLLGLHALAIASIWLAALPWQACAVSTALMFYSLWRLGTESEDIMLRCLDSGALELKRGPEWGEAEMLAGSFVWPFLSVLRLYCEGRHIFVAVLPDSMEHETFRRLRVWLRWKAANRRN